jgi:membrane protease YdiL (CAAX protease family)
MGGTALLASPASRIVGDPAKLTTQVLYQLILWALLGLVILIVIFWERRSLSSIGLIRWRWSSLTWGLGCAAFIISVNTVIVPFLTKLGIVDLSKGFAVVFSWPLWFRILAVVTAGTVEESLFRGYAIERLGLLTGSYGWAAGISLAVFGIVHLPFWGPGILFNALFGGAASTLLYIWRRDLAACIIAHVTVDAIALIVDPALHR